VVGLLKGAGRTVDDVGVAETVLVTVAMVFGRLMLTFQYAVAEPRLICIDVRIAKVHGEDGINVADIGATNSHNSKLETKRLPGL
jgi:hypothetical protein